MFLFDTPFQEFVELPEVGLVRKYNCLLLSEHLFIERKLDELRIDLEDPVMAIAFSPLLNTFLCAVLLISRVKATWTMEEVEMLAPEVQQAIADFVLGERRRWQPPPAAGSKKQQGSGEPVDWNQVYCRLARELPNDPRWTPERFGSIPMLEIEGAIAALNQLDLQQASMTALPMALGFTYLLKAQGVKRIDVADLEPYSREMKLQTQAAKIPPEGAQIMLDLIASGDAPQWAAAMVSPEVLKRAAGVQQ